MIQGESTEVLGRQTARAIRCATLLVTALLAILIAGCPATTGSPCTTDADCDDRDPCTTTHCNETGICTSQQVDSDTCADRDPIECRTDDECARGDPCTTYTCIPGGTCSNAPLCIDEICTEGQCVDCLTDTDCDDNLFCTTDSCTENQCTNTQIECDDGLFCNGVEACDESSEGTCISSGDPCVPACGESAQCNEITDSCCIDFECAVDAECDDGFFCTGIETCEDGLCRSTGNPCFTPTSCDEPDAEVCDEELNACRTIRNDSLDNSASDFISFTLATDTITGTAGRDPASAPLLFNPPTATALPSFQDGDSFDGGEGCDTVNIQFNFHEETTVQATLSSVETINITDFGTAPTTIDATNFSGVEILNAMNNTNPNPLFVGPLSSIVSLSLTNTLGSLVVEFDEEASTNAGSDIDLQLSEADSSLTIRTLAANNIGYLNIESTPPNNRLTRFVQSGSTELNTIRITGDADLRFIEPLEDSLTTILAENLNGDLTVTMGAGPAIINGGKGDDTLTASPKADTINAGSGNDRITPGKGIDTVSLGARSDILDLSDLTAADLIPENRTHITDATFDRSPYTGNDETDAFAFADVTTTGDLSNGLDPSQFQSVTSQGDLIIDPTTAVVELAWEFSQTVDLAIATDGVPLLAALGGTIQTPAIGHRQLIAAYQTETVYLYYTDSGDDTALTANEIHLIASARGTIAVGGLDASNFQP